MESRDASFWRQLREFGLSWFTGMGVASLIFAVFGIVTTTPGSALGFWLTAYVSLVAAVVIQIVNMRRQLKTRGLTSARRNLARQRIAGLREDEKAALRRLVVEPNLSGDQIRTWFAGVDFPEINRRTAFLNYDLLHDRWSVHQDWLDLLRNLLTESDAHSEKKVSFLRYFGRFSEHTQEVMEAIYDGAMGVWAAMKGQSATKNPSG